jgi:hypothetical protein
MGGLMQYSHEPMIKGSLVKEYLLVANMGADVAQQVKKETAGILDTFSGTAAAGWPYHLVLASFLAKEEMEDIILRWMHKVISSKTAFAVALNNYGGAPDAGTIHLRVQDHAPFAQLARELKVIDELVQSNGLPRARLVSHPCLTVAGGFSEPGYETALRACAAGEFHSEFEVKELVLLKRMHEFDECKQVNVFRLQP